MATTQAPLPLVYKTEIDDPISQGDFLYVEQFFAQGPPRDYPVSIANTDGFVEIPIQNVGRLEKIIIVVTDLFLPPSVVTIRFNINDGINPPFNMDIPSFKKFEWNIHPSFYSKIAHMYVSTTSIVKMNIAVRLIATSDPPPVV